MQLPLRLSLCLFWLLNSFLSFAQQPWQVLLWEDFNDIYEFQPNRPVRVETYEHIFKPKTIPSSDAPEGYYGAVSMGYQPATSGDVLVTNMPKIGFRVELNPDYEYKLAVDVETLLAHDVSFFIDDSEQNTEFISGPFTTQAVGSFSTSQISSTWSPRLYSGTFSVQEVGVYYIYITPVASQLLYQNLDAFTHDVFDNFKLERLLVMEGVVLVMTNVQVPLL